VEFEPMGSTNRVSVLDARSAPRRGEDRLRRSESIPPSPPKCERPRLGPFVFLPSGYGLSIRARRGRATDARSARRQRRRSTLFDS
jgi:hypothetical protein